ncbi:MAG: dihydrolipoyl dehydrogenase [Desulfarculus sp.]|nr:MAG: dihydrolipoyl dehydrogenase [Desulfarculus sp.]
MSLKLVVIGAGPGGYLAAIRAAQLGARVTLVEQARVGGTCLHWGCIPTKTLKATAQALEEARRLHEFGITSAGQFQADLAAINARKQQVIDVQTQGIEKLLQAWGVELLRGRARLLGPRRVEVELTRGGGACLEAERLILASGSRPADLPGLARDGVTVFNSDDALALKDIPGRLLIVGGGVVGCEFAFIYRALGSQVTLVEALERLLPMPSLDAEASRLLQREMKKRGIRVHLGRVVGELRRGPDGLEARLEPGPLLPQPAGAKTPPPVTVPADKVLVSVGRALGSEDMGLAEAGLRLERGAVQVDQRLAAGPEGVYAVGDVLGPGRPMLAHMAGAEARVAAANALGAELAVDYRVVPAVAFTTPEVAWVGLSPEQAAAQGLEAAAHVFQMRSLGKAQAMNELAGQCKLLSEKGSGRLLGAALVGARASEMIHECALALKLGATVADLAHTIHAHPTLSEAIAETAELALGQCLHAPPLKKG